MAREIQRIAQEPACARDGENFRIHVFGTLRYQGDLRTSRQYPFRKGEYHSERNGGRPKGVFSRALAELAEEVFFISYNPPHGQRNYGCSEKRREVKEV